MAQTSTPNPLQDLLHGISHPFPTQVEQLVLRIAQASPLAIRELEAPAESWARLRPDACCDRVVEFLQRAARDIEARRCNP